MLIQGGEPVTIKRRSETSVDAWGNPTYGYENILIRNALIAIGGTSEPIDPARDAVDASVTMYLPTGTEIREGDRFLIRDTEWVKDGSVQEWVSPFPGSEAGVVVPLRKRNG